MMAFRSPAAAVVAVVVVAVGVDVIAGVVVAAAVRSKTASTVGCKKMLQP